MEIATERMPRSDKIRRFLFLYAVTMILSLQMMAILHPFVTLPGPYLFQAVLVLVLFPLMLSAIGYRFFPPIRSQMPTRFWAGNALIMVGLWAGGYTLVGLVSAEGPFHTLLTQWDHLIPFHPGWVFIYVTVYAMFVFPLLYHDSSEDLVVLDLSQLLALGISYMAFIVYPVIFRRPSTEVVDFATWGLGVVQGSDPAWNCFPSTHCTACTIAGLSLLRHNRWLATWALLSTLVICASTLFTKQHYVLDAAAGALLGTASYCFVRVLVRKTMPGKRLLSAFKGS